MPPPRTRGLPADTPQAPVPNRASAGIGLHTPDQAPQPDESRLAQLLVDRSDEFILWFDAEARLLYGNPAICRALGYSQAEFAALHLSDISSRTPESWPARWQELKQQLSQTFSAELNTRSGEIIPVQFNANYIGGKEFVLCCGCDLRERQTTPANAAASRVDGVFVLQEGHVEDSEDEPSELFGGSRQQIIEELESMLSESGPWSEAMARALSGNEVTFGWRSQRADGSSFDVECTLCRIEIARQVRLLAVAVDATARRRSERTLAHLTGRLFEMQDEERRRIARELHDTTGQNLAALSIGLSMILSATPVDAHVRQALQESLALADSCVREVRTLSYLLHPPLLDELGLVSALRAYSDCYSEKTGLELDIILPVQMPRLPQAIETALFRIAQEGLTNVHRHSGSRKATLRVTHQPDRVELELVDYGRGLPPGTLGSGVGITGMRERARLVGGRLKIASAETGTTIHLVIPVSHPQQLNAAVGRP